MSTVIIILNKITHFVTPESTHMLLTERYILVKQRRHKNVESMTRVPMTDLVNAQ